MSIFKKPRVMSFIQPSKWLGIETHKANIHMIKQMIFSLSANNKSNKDKSKNKVSSFEQIINKNNLTEKDLNKRVKDAKKIVVFCAILCVTIFSYSIYLFTQSQIVAGFITLLLALNMCAYALREGFIIHQINNRTIKVTFKNWILNIFNKA